MLFFSRFPLDGNQLNNQHDRYHHQVGMVGVGVCVLENHISQVSPLRYPIIPPLLNKQKMDILPSTSTLNSTIIVIAHIFLNSKYLSTQLVICIFATKILSCYNTPSTCSRSSRQITTSLNTAHNMHFIPQYIWIVSPNISGLYPPLYLDYICIYPSQPASLLTCGCHINQTQMCLKD